ncbi:p21-C-terminal region-binding protein-domain-containing protein [Naematelia encephala]|uniref:Protein BCP1 n=1 Tax=Naematelia encephala TaxID=71784 RepID=A0A1Y2ARP9_9TREE|nr:p21-C-terminal region-binding protein-domain-containing protein [Naematelia encephala]
MPRDNQLEAISVKDAAKPSKRKSVPKENEDDSDSGSDSGSDISMLDVDFDFYNFNTDIDQIALKRLLRQTLSNDEDRIDVHPLAELILSEGIRMGAGSSIKTDGEDSDPWGLLAVIDVNRNRSNPAFKPFLDYIRSTLPSISPLRLLLDDSPSPAYSNSPALVFSLRVLNLPVPLIPPLYKMLLSELESADNKEVPKFTHWILWGRGYRLEGTEQGMGLEMTVENTGAGGKKKRKAKRNAVDALPASVGQFPYHPEEEFIDNVAAHIHTYPFKTAAPRDDDSFGVEQFGRLVLINHDNLAQAVQAMEAAGQ